jgi:ABC-type transporter Mla subunit MlaD
VILGLVINPITAAAYVTAFSGLVSVASVLAYRVSSRQRLQRLIQEIMFGTQGTGTWAGQKGLIDKVDTLFQQLSSLGDAVHSLASQVSDLARRLLSLEQRLDGVSEVVKELKPNEGKSLADKVDKTAKAVDHLQKQFNEHIVTAEKSQKALYEHIVDHEEKDKQGDE